MDGINSASPDLSISSEASRSSSWLPVSLAVSATTLTVSAVAIALIMAKVVAVSFVITTAVVLPVVGISLILVIALTTLAIGAKMHASSLNASHSIAAKDSDKTSNRINLKDSDSSDQEIDDIINCLLSDSEGSDFAIFKSDLPGRITDKSIIVQVLKEIISVRKSFSNTSFHASTFMLNFIKKYSDEPQITQIVLQLFNFFNPAGNNQPISDYMPIAMVTKATLREIESLNKLKDPNSVITPSADTLVVQGPALRKLKFHLEQAGKPFPENEFKVICSWDMNDCYVYKHEEKFTLGNKEINRQIPRSGTYQATVHLGEESKTIGAELNLTKFLPSEEECKKQNIDPANRAIAIFSFLKTIFDNNGIDAQKTRLEEYFNKNEIGELETVLTIFANDLIDQYNLAYCSLLDKKVKDFLDKFPSLADAS